MKVADLIEAIDDPSGLIHPEKHQAFARGTHPLAGHPAYPAHQPQPGDRTTNYEEILASKQWQKILQKGNQYLGVPLTAQALHVIQRKMLSALALIDQVEGAHREELETLAVELVFELPEFSVARKAYESGRLAIQPELTGEMGDMSDEMATSDEEEALPAPPQQRTPAEEQWMKKMVQRRHFTNAMIQGSAVSNDFLFELAGRRLDQIDPGLRQAYGVLMISTEIGYWMFPQDMIIAGARQKTHIGSSQVDIEQPEQAEQDDPENPAPQQQQQVPVVKARGACFPVLIQEIIKGLTEVASLASLPRDPSERAEVIRQADMVDLESWSMILGPKLWDSFIEAIDAENERELTMHLYRHIQTMDVDQFNAFMKELLAKSPKGMKMLRELAAQIKAEIAEDEGGEENPVAEAQEIVRQMIENELDDDPEIDDWKDVTELNPSELHPTFNQPHSGIPASTVAYYVRRFGLEGTESSHGTFFDGDFYYVTVSFDKRHVQTDMTAKFYDAEDAEKFAAWIDELNTNRKLK